MQRLAISWRLYSLVLLSLVILGGAMVFSLFQSYASSERERKAGLAQMNDVALTVLKKYQALEASGAMTREQAQTEAKAVISVMRYGDGSGYFWLNDMLPRMIMHPIKAELNGKDLSNDKDPNGKFLFVEFVNAVKASPTGKGFVDYYWPKPGAEQPVEKYSHVAGFAPWGWIVGTGVYVDDLHAMFRRDAINFASMFGIGALVLIAGATFVVKTVTGPIGKIRQALQSIASGEARVTVPCTEQKNEIGEMARALSVLRDSVDERVQLQAREAEQARMIASERSDNERTMTAAAERQGRAISELGRALEALAGGDLSVALVDIGEDYAKLRHDFNAAVGSLHQAIAAISETSLVVRDSASDISGATGHLSKRTEQQAAALEETAAALDEITATVRTASERAVEARTMVSETKDSAGRSGEIVRNAIDAMGRIEESSNRINQIISVIDEIAFQTNLLALNAGVEAARAGEAGRGFAVVAQEVRELAQRSANAAKEIKTLISNSAREVEGGVALVRSTGDALVEIATLVERVNAHVDTIATAAREQATGLQEINSSVNHMDQMTQQNAAMVEETTAASQTLAEQSLHLQGLLSAFRLGSGGRAATSGQASRARAA
ncbi:MULTISPECIES: methyl-accepting chemotaxis protein [unclassified Neorhizobium]|uniref:methyl-accepting chemotaxis protein n=1 Tax=unclassified Neorhizobium TaxID=2629175 RepID=UPI001FF6C070|nr:MULTISPECIES: methyl-accepting chemotaxis protein [unclassified Neorhizobium]MCJ9674771.1 methyl-accepting chemotaxis protein [Neorhizobium sp. SHOUNA12B]MCJ9748906.1 methyl-accepting chemotaxis protein [Neorhizobium sp. SHOUNA12A]